MRLKIFVTGPGVSIVVLFGKLFISWMLLQAMRKTQSMQVEKAPRSLTKKARGVRFISKNRKKHFL